MLVFKEREKPEYPEKNLFEQRRGPTTNSTPTYGIAARSRTRATLVGAMRHPCSPSVPLARHALSSTFRKMQKIHLEEKERILKEDR